ncbi:MAG TPA: shikimate dehydrogenase [Allosphingosinicella sp.]|jgi:shikimate dehydrogenase
MGIPYAEVIGDPIAHSKSPLIHEFWLEKLGLEGGYRRCRVSVNELGAYLVERAADADWRGCNVTMPLKEKVSGCVTVQPETAKIGAVNTIYRSEGALLGANTDVLGILDILPADCFVGEAVPETCIIGAGGAARAMLEACRRLNTSLVFFNVRDRMKGFALLEEWGFGGAVGEVDNEHNLVTPYLVVNASPLGMQGGPPMPEGVLNIVRSMGDCAPVIFDMVYDPVDTALLRAAKDKGLRTVDGLSLLVGQARHGFRLFFGIEAPTGYDADLRELLTR